MTDFNSDAFYEFFKQCENQYEAIQYEAIYGTDSVPGSEEKIRVLEVIYSMGLEDLFVHDDRNIFPDDMELGESRRHRHVSLIGYFGEKIPV